MKKIFNFFKRNKHEEDVREEERHQEVSYAFRRMFEYAREYYPRPYFLDTDIWYS